MHILCSLDYICPNSFVKWLPKNVFSYVLPQTIEAGKTALGQTYEVNYENGHKVLNSANVNYKFWKLASNHVERHSGIS